MIWLRLNSQLEILDFGEQTKRCRIRPLFEKENGSDPFMISSNSIIAIIYVVDDMCLFQFFKKAENNFINRPTLIIFDKFWDSHIRQKRYERDIK